MNFMRKIVSGQPQRGMADGAPSPQDNQLGLMHLRKLFSEFRYPPAGASPKELEDKLYNMLPLFCKVFGTAPSSDMMEKFGDILQFCSHVSRLMVSEIRRRASNQSTDAASCAIVKFLEIESTEVSSNGWMLLSSINLLSTGPSSLIDCMTAASLPSTLVKCLYLFFDLPPVERGDDLETGCEFTPRERRILLQKVFVQVLVRLSSHLSPAEELARKDDLTLLFSAITSWCPPHNVPWRKSAAEVLMTLSRHGLSPNVVQYIHTKGCTALCIDNMQRVQELSPIELVEMLVTVFCFLKDSSEVSQTLLDDFRACHGYIFLSEFLLRMEVDTSEESIQALRNLVLLVGSLTTCGFIELKPTNVSSGSLFQMPGFTVPQPTGKGVSVRNIQAFQVLQSVFLKANSSHLCSTILDVISSIYHQDNANYFILEAQCTLSQFAEKIHLKTPDVQVKFFEMLEFIVFNLNYVPCKEFISLSILIKTNHLTNCSILCMKTLHKILRCHVIYKDVFREVGLLEVMVTCLHRYAALLKDPNNDDTDEVESIPEQEQEMGFLVMDTLTVLLNGNSQNASVFRECGGARCAHNMVPYKTCRHAALNIVEQLVLSNGGDDDMGTLLGLMHTAPTIALELKMHLLQSLLHVLRESHRTRTVFRRVGGFVYVMSVLVSMEGCLADPPKAPWDSANRKDMLALLKTVFSTLTVAMRYEPANAKFFATEVRYASLTEAVRLLGCFSCDVDIQCYEEMFKPRESTPFSDFFYTLEEQRGHHDLPKCLVSACLMLRYFYDMALDNFDKPVAMQTGSTSPNLKRICSVMETGHEYSEDQPNIMKRASTGSVVLNLAPVNPEPVIVHPGAVISMLHLTPGVTCTGNKQLVLDMQAHLCNVLKSLMRSERNQQVMCEAGLPQELLTHCNISLANENHPLHPPIQYMFERLAAQCLTPKDLRDFMRLGTPLCSVAESDDNGLKHRNLAGPTYAVIEKPNSASERQKNNDISKKLRTNGGAVPLTRVKCLVSMTTPRDVRLHGASITPAFVEFDMNAEGFGCLYLASIAPQGPPTPSVVGAGMIGGNDPGVIGGIGTGERLFPPQSGMTYSTWICVDKFSSPVTDAHPVRLLTVVRNIQGREENLICLSVYLAPRDRALFVSTQETHLPVTVESSEVDHWPLEEAGPSASHELELEPILNDTNVRFWCPELTQEGQWRHLVLIFHKAGIMKNSSVSMFVDGTHVSTQKLHYISPNLGGGGTASPNAATTVFTYIGTPPQLRRKSKLVWRQGPCHLLEEVISVNTVQSVYQLGPNYVGSFQSPLLANSEIGSALITEEKVMFGVHAHAMSLMTIAKIRKVYNKVDAKSIAKQLGMSAHENATPIRILHNSAGHLSGPARSFGAILMGYLGVRTFCPRPVAKMVLNIGGTSALLGLIAMATDVEGLYAAVKALVCVVRSNKAAQREMDRTKGYQTLSMLFKKKRHLLNSHILHLTFSLVGTVDSGRESTVIPNRAAFEDLLCDLEVWHEAPSDLQRSLYEHFFELLTESSEQRSNLRLMLELGLVGRMLHILKDPNLSKLTLTTISSVLTVLLSGATHPPSLLRFGQFLVSTLPPFSVDEKSVILSNRDGKSTDNSETNKQDNAHNDGIVIETPAFVSAHNIHLRNSLMEILLKLLTIQSANGINPVVCDEIQRVLGFDWLLLFMQSHVHRSTVILSMRILILMLSNTQAMTKFRDGAAGGGWLSDTECVVDNRIGAILGLNLNTSTIAKQENKIHHEICHIPGFTALQWLLPRHTDVHELYLLLMALLLGQPSKELPSKQQFDLDSVLTFVFGAPAGQPAAAAKREPKSELCSEAAVVLLCMVRAMLNQSSSAEEDSLESLPQDFPVTLMQFLFFLYHNQPEFPSLCMTGEFLCGLASTLFPYRNSSESNSELSSPQDDFKPFPGADTMVLVKETEKPQGQKYEHLLYDESRMHKENVKATLTTHPARKFVMDLLRMIVVDSLSIPPSSKSAAVIDLLLEASPEHASVTQRREFQTEILKSLMDHILAADALLGDQAALPIATGGSYIHMANNVFYFASRVVDKLWQGAYLRDSKEVFDFVSQLISQAKRKASGLSLDVIYKCLNRAILYQLSRPMYAVADQMNVLDALHKLTSNRSLVFGPGNYDQEFIGCLCYCLLQLTEDPNISESPGIRHTTWHVDPEVDIEFLQKEAMNKAVASNDEGLQLVANAASRVWEELYVCKKPTIEEIFKVSLNQSGDAASPRITTPDLQSVRSWLTEPATRLWLNYFDNERKCSYSQTERIHSQLQSKLQKVSSGVLRLASRKAKKELPVKVSTATVHDAAMWTLTHIAIVKDLVEIQYKQYCQSQEHHERYLLEDWTQTEAELMRERGLWGPPVGSELDKSMLDMTEGPHRMRKKMMRNDMFYIHYPFRPDQLSFKPVKYKVAVSKDSEKYFQRYRSQSLVGDDNLPLARLKAIADGVRVDDPETPQPEVEEERYPEMPMNIPSLLPRTAISKHNANKSMNDIEEECELEVSNADQTIDEVPADSDKTDNQMLLRLLEDGEKITSMNRVARIQGLDTAEGLLLFGREHFYVVDGFTLVHNKAIADIDSLPPDLYEPIIPKSSMGSSSPKRRYKLHIMSDEYENQTSVLIQFSNCNKFSYEDIREVHKRRYLLQPIAIEVFSADGRNQLLAFDRKVRNKVYAKFLQVGSAITDNAQDSVSGQKLSAKVEPGTGLISSLIGEKSVTQRWERGEISNFEYLMCLNTLAGRSYNDLMQYPVFPWIVADYDSEELDINNPASFRDLSKPMGIQTPDRLKQFQKRYNDWDDPQGETPPYHYGTHYSSAMIVASYLVRMEPFTQHFLRLQGGHFDLADRMFHSVKECWLSASKHNMADVKELIPEFFYLPEFLSNSNNFDLGTKQSGVPLGHCVLPLWAKGDPREFIRAHREALECDYVSAHLHEWIDLIFGYKQQGPAAVDAVNVFHHLFYEGNVDIDRIDDPLKRNATIGFINNFGQIPKQLFKKPHPSKKLNVRNLDPLPMGALIQNQPDKMVFFHNVDNLKPTMTPIKELKGSVGQIIQHDKSVLAVEQNKVLIPPHYGRYLAWGFSDLSVRVGNYDSDKATAIFENLDNGEILCAVCPNAKTVVTAGTSTVVNVWEFGKGKDRKNLLLKQPLFGHTEPVTCLAASSAYNVIISGSRDRTCIIWDFSRLVFVRQLRGHAAPVAAVCINELTGDIATCAGTYLHMWTINGDEIASCNTATSRNHQIFCVSMSQMNDWDIRNVIMTGNSDGVVRMWSLEFVEVPDESQIKPKEEKQEVEKPSQTQTVSAPQVIPTAPRTALALSNQEHDFKDHLSAKDVDLGSSAESDGGNPLDDMKEQFEKRLSVKAPKLSQLKSEHDLISFDDPVEAKPVENAVDALTEIDGSVQSTPKTAPPRPAKPPTSPNSDFVFVTDSEVKDAVKTATESIQKFSPLKRRGLRDGFRWQRQLVFRSKLTMHTAFERKDNKDPAAVTSIAVSKDHKTVYVGDAKGRVYSWSVTDQPGRVVADHWIKDEGTDSCIACSIKFSFSERRHHCRNCGQLFCSKCSRFEAEIQRLRIMKPVRVCQACYTMLKTQQGADASAKSAKLAVRS